MLLRAAHFVMLLGLFTPHPHAAEFTSLCDSQLEKARGCAIRMNGEIVAGDASRLTAVLAKKAPHIGVYSTLILNSPGGDVEEAFRIADVTRGAVLETSTVDMSQAAQLVSKRKSPSQYMYRCASSCFLIWAAGARRQHVSSDNAPPIGLGLHRPYFAKQTYASSDVNNLARRQQELTSRVKEYLVREAIPQSLIEEMMRRSSREILWLDSSSAGPDHISEYAPWFEELLIARCGFDPARMVDEEDRIVRAIREAAQSGKDHLNRLEESALYKGFVERKQRIEGCLLHEIRLPAQSKGRGSGS